MKATQFPNAKFTPGPWRQHPKAKGNIENIDGRVVANCLGYQTNTDNGEHHDENLNNAKLIASSPNLLLSLFNLVNAVSGGSQEDIKIALADAKQTIKNATNV